MTRFTIFLLMIPLAAGAQTFPDPTAAQLAEKEAILRDFEATMKAWDRPRLEDAMMRLSSEYMDIQREFKMTGDQLTALRSAFCHIAQRLISRLDDAESIATLHDMRILLECDGRFIE